MTPAKNDFMGGYTGTFQNMPSRIASGTSGNFHMYSHAHNTCTLKTDLSSFGHCG